MKIEIKIITSTYTRISDKEKNDYISGYNLGLALLPRSVTLQFQLSYKDKDHWNNPAYNSAPHTVSCHYVNSYITKYFTVHCKNG